MEFSSIKIQGCPVHVIFNGNGYYFVNDFYGLLAVAVRVDNNLTADSGPTWFELVTGNRHTIGGRLSGSKLLGALQKFIRKSENKFITKKVFFHYETRDLADDYLQINYVQRS